MGDKIFEWVKEVIIKIGKWILMGTINNSYWLCLIICLGALIVYIAGQKKAAKYMPISIIIYYFLNCLKLVIK